MRTSDKLDLKAMTSDQKVSYDEVPERQIDYNWFKPVMAEIEGSYPLSKAYYARKNLPEDKNSRFRQEEVVQWYLSGKREIPGLM